MILLRGKVGHRRLHEPRQVRLAGLSFLALFAAGGLLRLDRAHHVVLVSVAELVWYFL